MKLTAKQRADRRHYQKNKQAIRKRAANYYLRTRDEQIARATKRYWDNRTRELRLRVLRRYGLTLAEFRLMRRRQANKCVICKRVFRTTPHIDHDHQTGVVRGLLCKGCNLGLGNFRDNIRSMRRAIRYLQSV